MKYRIRRTIYKHETTQGADWEYTRKYHEEHIDFETDSFEEGNKLWDKARDNIDPAWLTATNLYFEKFIDGIWYNIPIVTDDLVDKEWVRRKPYNGWWHPDMMAEDMCKIISGESKVYFDENSIRQS